MMLLYGINLTLTNGIAWQVLNLMEQLDIDILKTVLSLSMTSRINFILHFILPDPVSYMVEKEKSVWVLCILVRSSSSSVFCVLLNRFSFLVSCSTGKWMVSKIRKSYSNCLNLYRRTKICNRNLKSVLKRVEHSILKIFSPAVTI